MTVWAVGPASRPGTDGPAARAPARLRLQHLARESGMRPHAERQEQVGFHYGLRDAAQRGPNVKPRSY